jgi:hypothetical protein
MQTGLQKRTPVIMLVNIYLQISLFTIYSRFQITSENKGNEEKKRSPDAYAPYRS